MRKTIIFIVLAAVAAGGALLYRQNLQLHEQLLTMQARMSALMQQPRAGGHGGRRADPYIAGAVKNTILKHYAAIGAIYKRYLATHPKKESGHIKMDWQITPDGRVLEPGIVFSELDPGSLMEQQMLREAAGWRFPPPPSGMTRYIAHTFRFREHPMTEAEKARARQSIVNSIPAQAKHP